MVSGKQPGVSTSALLSMVKAASTLLVPACTTAPCVAKSILLRTALPSPTNHDDLFKIVTPYHWQVWESMLADAGVLDCFADIPFGIHFGWHLGVPDSYCLTSCFLPPNHCLAIDHTDFILDYVQAEIKEGRYSGPFDPEFLEHHIGPFCSSPLGVIPKPDSSKFCLIQDHTFPRRDSAISFINSLIDTSFMEVEWGTFSDCWLLVTCAPPGAQCAVFDIEAAHCRSSLAPEDQHLVCVKTDFNGTTEIFVDHCASFGGASSSFLFEHPASGIVAIYHFKDINDLTHWSDDFIFLHYPCVCLSSHYHCLRDLIPEF